MSKVDWTEVFISHSSKDAAYADELLRFMNECIDFDQEAIVCTTAEGHGLEIGTKFEKRLRNHLEAADVLVALVSEASLGSLFCTFEMGAAWGLKTPTKPVLIPGLSSEKVPRPLSSLHFLAWSDDNAWIQLIEEISELTGNELRIRISRVAVLAKRLAEFRAP